MYGFDSEADFPDISSVKTTLYMGVNVTPLPLSANTPRDWAQENEDSSAMDSALNKGNPAGNIPLEEEGPNKAIYWVPLPLKASPHHLFRVIVVEP